MTRADRGGKGRVTKQQQALAVRCVQLKYDLMQAGLYATGHAMEAVVKMVGWEMAGDIGGVERMHKLVEKRP